MNDLTQEDLKRMKQIAYTKGAIIPYWRDMLRLIALIEEFAEFAYDLSTFCCDCQDEPPPPGPSPLNIFDDHLPSCIISRARNLLPEEK